MNSSMIGQAMDLLRSSSSPESLASGDVSSPLLRWCFSSPRSIARSLAGENPPDWGRDLERTRLRPEPARACRRRGRKGEAEGAGGRGAVAIVQLAGQAGGAAAEDGWPVRGWMGEEPPGRIRGPLLSLLSALSLSPSLLVMTAEAPHTLCAP